MTEETVLSNAHVVLADEVIVASVLLRDGKIAEIGTPAARRRGSWRRLSAAGLRRAAYRPARGPLQAAAARAGGRRMRRCSSMTRRSRPRASPRCSMRCASGSTRKHDMGREDMVALGAAIERASTSGRLRADHFIHLRCEVSAPDCLEGFALLGGPPAGEARLADGPRAGAAAVPEHGRRARSTTRAS